MAAVHELAPALGNAAACAAVGLWRGAPARQRARASAHARHDAFVGPHRPRAPRSRPPLALDAAEHQLMLDTLNSERFADTAPAATHATLLDEGVYLGSVRTRYRVLGAHGASRERRNQRVHPAYTKPELLAVQPNQVWSWDITQAQGSGQVDLLPSLRDPGHLQSLGWWAGCSPSARTQTSPSSSSPTRWRATTSSPARSHCTPTVAPACAPNRWRHCWWTWTSPRATAGPMYRMTTRTPRRSSRR